MRPLVVLVVAYYYRQVPDDPSTGRTCLFSTTTSAITFRLDTWERAI